MKEIERRDVPGYEGYYQADSEGNVWSLKRTVDNGRGGINRVRGRKIKGNLLKNRYYSCSLYREGKQKTTYIHRVVAAAFGIINLNDGSQEVDHINHDRGDNRPTNLRCATSSQNHQHGGAKLRGNNKSGFRGVSCIKNSKKWRASIRINNKFKHLGHFTCRIEAARVYDAAAREYFGEFANLNFNAV